MCIRYVELHSFQLIEMEAATLGGTLDPGLSIAREAAKEVPPRKRPPEWKSTFFNLYSQKLSFRIRNESFFVIYDS